MKKWKRLAALSSAIVMAAATLTYFPSDTLQNIRLEISASAETTTEPQVWIEDNLTWTLGEDGTLIISGTGAMKDYDYNNNQSPVYMNSSVKKVVIEDGVTSIGNWAFYKCTSLTTITIPDSVTSIGDWAFYKCTSLTTITIPDSVTSIGEAAFRGCSSLTSITIPDSVTSIGDAAFSHCSNLKSITIPDSITSIGKYAFCNCSSLTSITIPNSVTSIGESALAGCVNLTSITIPKSVTSIGSGVFDGCNNLTVYLESGSTLTSNDLGVNESKIGSYWVEDNLTWKLDADGTLTISGTGAMKDYDYNNNPSPANQKKGSVKKVVIKDGVTSIGKDAFKNCSNLKSITILDSVTSIGDFAFSDCSSLTSITIPDSVTSIGDFAFSGCSSLTSITILDSVTSITIPDSVTSIGDFAFSGCSSLTSITIPDSVTSIGESAFSYCRSLTSITIPDRVTSIGNLAFYDCSGLTSITIPNGVTSIGESAFSYCRSLTSITIPDSVTSIGSSAFNGCSSLQTISLSCKSSLKKSDFGDQADLVSYTSHTLKKTEAKDATCSESGNKEYWTCEHCGKYFLSDDTNPETATAVELSETVIPALKHKNATTRGVVEPNGTKPGYSGDRYCPDCDTVLEKGYTYWNEDNLTWKLYEDGKLTISGTGAMKNYNYYNNPSPAFKNSNVKKVVIEDGVTSIGNSAFDSCSSLTSITLSNNITNIGNDAFAGCRSLTSITIPDSVTSIGDTAFAYCYQLTSITIPDSVTSIGEATFYYCSGLTSITIPDSVTSIGSSAFKNCSNLTTISLSCKSTLKRSDFGEQTNLVSYTSHTLKKTAAKAVTCTENGNKEYWTCEHCKKYFLSDDTNPETAKAVELSETVISASHKLTKVEAKAATCAENGNKEYWTCEHCKKYFLSDDTNPETATAVEQSETVIPALKHKNAIIQNASEPTETAPGYSGDRYCPDCDKVVEKGYTYWIEDNLTWKLYADGTLNISGKGAMKDYNSDDNPSPVYNNSNVKKVVIEDGVTSIGDYAFRSCNNLTSIMISNSVTSIGNSAFFYCTSLTSVTIPDNVTSIENYAFAYTGLKSITIPDSVTNIGNYAFAGCKDLTSITIPDSVTSIGNYAFYNCSSLTSITIPDSVTSIGTATFSGCKNLTSITIPDSVTSIGNSAFVGCKNLTSITIPDSVTSIGESTFKYCSNLKTISLSCKSSLKRNDFGEQADLVSYTNQHLLTKTAAKAATCTEDGNKEYWTCEHCGKYFLSDDTNPETAKAVEQAETVIPASHKLTKVEAKDATCAKDGNKAYWTCEHCKKYFLSDDTNPETAKAVELSETVIPALKHKNATTRGAVKPTETAPGYSGDRYCPDCDTVLEKGYTYWNEGNLTWKLDADGTLTISGTGAMKDYNSDDNRSPVYRNSNVKKIVIEDDVTSIGESAFEWCENLTSIKIADSVTSIGNNAFYGCGLTSIMIPNSVTKIGDATFAVCKSLTNITIPDNVTSIGEWAFAGCESLTSITIPDNVTSIGDSAFSGCSSLTSITIPDSVTSIGNLAFYDCSGLTSITIPNGVTSIGDSAFAYCERLNSITIPKSVTSIGEFAFSYCGSLKSITIPDRVTSIENWAFAGCSSLTSITLPDSVTSIGEYAFSDCSNLKSIIIPNSVTSIGYGAFNSCSSLTSITIPDSVTSIENGAFAGCSSLTSITLPDSVTSIGNGAFYGCSSLTSITIPDSVTSIGDSAFSDCTNLKTISLSCKSSLKKSDFGDQADLVSALHTLKKTEAKAATYAENGNKAYWTCEHCKKYFLSDDTNPETAKAVELSETVIPALVQIATTTTPIKCVYGQDMSKIDLRDYVKNTDVVGEVTVKVATGSTLPDGMKLDNGKISGKPAKAYEDGKEVTFTFTAENGSTANLTLLFLVAKADPTVEVAVSGDSHTEGDLVGELELILSENSTKGVVELVSEIKALVAGKNTFTWKFTPEDENNYHTVTGTVVVNAQTTTTTTTKATTTTTKATTTTNATTTTKPSKTTTTKVTTTTKPNKTTTTKATTTTKPSKTTTTKVTTTTKPSKTTTTKVTTTTKPSKTTTTKVTTTTKPSKTTTTKVTTTTKPSKTTTTKVTTTTKPSKTTTTNVTTTTKPIKTTTTNATTTNKPSKTTTTNVTTTNTAIPFYGDVNLDGKVDIVDAIFLNKYLATLIQFSDAQMANADCCQDGVLNDQDTTALMQFIILLIDDLPVQPTEK